MRKHYLIIVALVAVVIPSVCDAVVHYDYLPPAPTGVSFAPIGDDTGGYARVAESFEAQADDTSIKVTFDAWIGTGTPTYDIAFELWSDDGGVPSKPSALLASWSIDYLDESELSGVSTRFDLTDSGLSALSTGTKYWAVLESDCADVPSCWYWVDSLPDNPMPLNDYARQNDDGGAWTVESVDLHMRIETGTGENPPPSAPVITVPSAPFVVTSLPVLVEGTCEYPVNIDFYNDLTPLISDSYVDSCLADSFVVNTGTLANGDYTIAVCNVGFPEICDFEDLEVDVLANPNPYSSGDAVVERSWLEEQLLSVGELIKSKVPIRYFFDVKEIYDGLEFDPDAKPVLSVNISSGPLSGSYTVVDFDEAESFVGVSAWSALMALIKYSIWMLFVVYLIMRYRNILE